MQTNNTIPELYPAFNRFLLELEDSNYLKEKHNYILDILTDETIHSFVFDSAFFGYPGLASIGGGIGTSQYTPGDYVVVRTITATTDYEGIYKVVAVPNDTVVVLDTPLINAVSSADIRVYRIFRNKLPANPLGRALFNTNAYATGRVYHDFGLNNTGLFNVPNSFDNFQALPSEEYYENGSYTRIEQDTGNAMLIGFTMELSVGQTVQIIGDSVNTYDGIYQIVATGLTAFLEKTATLNRGFVGNVLSSGVIIALPKVPVWYYSWGDLTDDKIIFNGALSFPEVLAWDPGAYDMSQFIEAPFLTTAPSRQKIKHGQRAYTQFYQSVNTTAQQFAIDVIDDLGVTHQYIVNSQASPENFVGLALGPYDLNALDVLEFDTVPARGLPVIQECDAEYCVYLWGENLCNIQGVQNVNFAHPYGAVIQPLTWAQQNASTYEIEVQQFEIGGVPQVFTPTGNTYNQATVTGQTEEEIYSNELGLQTGLTVLSEIQYQISNPGALAGQTQGHYIEIDFSQDFYLLVLVQLNSAQLGAGARVEVEYNWDSARCKASYRIRNGKTKLFKPALEAPGFYAWGSFSMLPGFIGMTPTLTAPDIISEKLCFELDKTPYAYTGVRVLFQDRLGSFVGYNFNLKRTRTIETSSDGYEKDVYEIEGINSITRGFETIQNSYAESWELLTDFLSEEDAKYLEECYTSPNIYVQRENEVYPAVIVPDKQIAQEKENTALRQVGITIRVNRTQYSQRN